MIETRAPERIKVEVPNLEDKAAVEDFLASLEGRHSRGVKTLVEYIKKYGVTKRILEDQFNQIQTSARYINGETMHGGAHQAKQSLEAAARAYFRKLSPLGLQQQCTLFGVVYDSYEDVNAIIEALVERQAALLT